jgi:putative tryptophan/tyrosine transport system substrate-binding protein
MATSSSTRRLGGAAIAWPLAARAQHPALPVIGFLDVATTAAHLTAAFNRGLGEQGYVDGRNVEILLRYAETYAGLPALAEELVRSPAAVIFASGGPASALAAKSATTTIPIVFANGADPVELGLVGSFNRPGGNITGVTFLIQALLAKRLELLHKIATAVASIGLLVNPTGPQAALDAREAETAARALGMRLAIQNASTPTEIEAAFSRFNELRVGAVLVGGEPFFFVQREQLTALAARHSVPAIYPLREYVEAGGLMSYGVSQADAFRLGGVYVGQILKGAKPADLPVQQSTKVKLMINLKTAKALGLTIPETLLATADEVIQ